MLKIFGATWIEVFPPTTLAGQVPCDRHYRRNKPLKVVAGPVLKGSANWVNIPMAAMICTMYRRTVGYCIGIDGVYLWVYTEHHELTGTRDDVG